MECPECPTLLAPVHLGAMEIDQCSTCHGIWFDEGELEKLMNHEILSRLLPAGAAPAAGKRGVRRPCPRCADEKMEEVEVQGAAGLFIDICPTCKGYWLDGGELHALRQRLRPSSR